MGSPLSLASGGAGAWGAGDQRPRRQPLAGHEWPASEWPLQRSAPRHTVRCHNQIKALHFPRLHVLGGHVLFYPQHLLERMKRRGGKWKMRWVVRGGVYHGQGGGSRTLDTGVAQTHPSSQLQQADVTPEDRNPEWPLQMHPFPQG